MTASARKIDLPGLSFCAYQDNHRSQNAAKFEQAVIALEIAKGHAEKIEDPAEKAEAFRMLYVTEQALLAALGTANLKDFSSDVGGIIQKLESFPKLFPINREAARCRMNSVREKIASTNLPQKAPEKAKGSYQAGLAGELGSPELATELHEQPARKAPVKAEKVTEGAATTSAQTPASKDLHFPPQKELLKCLSEHPLTKSSSDKQQKVNEAAAKSFGNETRVPLGVVIGAMVIWEKFEREPKHWDQPLSKSEKNLTRALLDCAKPAPFSKSSDHQGKPLPEVAKE